MNYDQKYISINQTPPQGEYGYIIFVLDVNRTMLFNIFAPSAPSQSAAPIADPSMLNMNEIKIADGAKAMLPTLAWREGCTPSL